MSTTKPTVVAELVWSEGLRLGVTGRHGSIVIDGDGRAGPSPVDLLVYALAGCMAIDVVDILRKGRHDVRALRTTISAERNPDPPRRVLGAEIRFHLEGQVPEHAARRAVELSRDRYCSVWHSMRQDIALRTSVEIVAS